MVNVHELVMHALGGVVLALEVATALVIVYAAARTLWRLVRSKGHARLDIRHSFGRMLLLALDFAIASDVIRVAIAPTLRAVGVAALAVLVRVILTFVLERELKNEEEEARMHRQAGAEQQEDPGGV